MRKAYILAATLFGGIGLAALTSSAAQARDYPVCIERYGPILCYYDTYAQCYASASGTGGSCSDNPLYPQPQAQFPGVTKQRPVKRQYGQ